MKKALCLLLSFVFLLSLSACGKKNGGNGSAGKESSSENVSAALESGSDAKIGGKTLVVYFSATGSTERVAKSIAEILNADIFEITPETPYSSDDLNWNDSDSRVSREHNDESLRNVPLQKNTPDNWEDYDTVYIGYPKMEYLNKSVYSA